MAAIAVAVVFVPSALAVHDLSFQLDGDVSTHAYTTVNANQVYDWGANTTGSTSTQASPNTNGLFTVTDTGTAPTGTEAVTNNSTLVGDGKPFGAAGFVRDFRSGSTCTLNSLSTTFCTSDTSTYATGSKDTLGIGNGGWQCNKDNNVNSKIDIMNAYAASFTGGGTSNTDHNIYFGLEKNKDNGTNDVGVWLLQGTASCDNPSGGSGKNFTGAHQNKDVLVVSEFSNGGGVSTIKAFQWAAAASGPLSGDGGCIDSNDNPNPKTGGCNGLPISTSNSDCKITGGNDSLCATTNAKCTDTTKACGKQWNDTLATPWLTSDATLGVGRDQIVSPDFYEGGIDLTKVFQGAGETAPSCFNTVVPDTRSSATVTATLFDFVAAQLGECHSSTVTTPQDGSGTPIPAAGLTLPADPANASVSVQDSAAISVNGLSGSFSGSVAFHICGPTATSSTQLCDGSTSTSTPACGTTISCVGVDVGSKSITASGTVVSNAVTLTEAGRYCFRAEFTSTTTGVPASSDSSATECFVINPRNPTLSTQAGAGPVDFGSAVTDTADLGNTVHEQGTGGPTGSDGSINPTSLGGDAQGQITFTLYKANCTTQATGTGTNPQTVAVSGNGTYGPVSFTPDAPGTYHWVASYNGDSPNTGTASHNSACDDTNEDVVVQQIPTDIKTKQSWFPQDTATITATITGATLGAGGTVDFFLYNDGSCGGGSGTVQYSERQTLTGGSHSEEVGTHNYTGSTAKTPSNVTVTPYRQDTAYADGAGSILGPFSWKVVYTLASGDTAHLPVSSTCTTGHTESHSITYGNDPGGH